MKATAALVLALVTAVIMWSIVAAMLYWVGRYAALSSRAAIPTVLHFFMLPIICAAAAGIAGMVVAASVFASVSVETLFASFITGAMMLLALSTILVGVLGSLTLYEWAQTILVYPSLLFGARIGKTMAIGRSRTSD